MFLGDHSSPPHAGFQIWFGVDLGPILFTPPGWAIYLANHSAHEGKEAFEGPAGRTSIAEVEGAFTSVLGDILAEWHEDNLFYITAPKLNTASVV